MKKSFNIVVLSILILCSFINTFAQEKTVSEQDITNLKDTAYEKLKDKVYRVTMTSEGYMNAKDSSPNQFVKEITEYISPDRRHSIYERKTGETTFREETISIGQKKYVRRDNGNWKELSLIGNSAGNGTGSGSGFKTAIIDNEKTVECKYKGKETIKNQKADLYVLTTTRRYNSPNFKSTTVITEKFWLDKDGIFLKRESETKLDYKKVISHIVWEYQYDPNIKIEAPRIETVDKKIR